MRKHIDTHKSTHIFTHSLSLARFHCGVLSLCHPLQCGAVCCVLQCVTACCSVLQCVAVCCSVLQCVAVCCSVLQFAAVCCSELPCIAVYCRVLPCVDGCRRVLPCVLGSHDPLMQSCSLPLCHTHKKTHFNIHTCTRLISKH